MSKPMDDIKRDIVKARQWAREHFNVGQKEDHLLGLPTFDIEYPEPDLITIWPRVHGHRLWPGVTYKLCWRGAQLVWKGTNPLTNTAIEMIVRA